MNPAQTPERLLEVTQLVDATGLMVLGGLHPEETDLVPTGCKTLILLGPKDQHFWPIFAKSPEKAARTTVSRRLRSASASEISTRMTRARA